MTCCGGEPIEHIIVALSNIVYFILAYWLFKNKQYLLAIFIVFVGIASIVFHLEPEWSRAKSIDMFLAYTTIFLSLLCYLPKTKMNSTVILSTLSAVAAYILYESSGNDRLSDRYVITHSLWHILTAVATYFLVENVLEREALKEGLKGGIKHSLKSIFWST